jgi:hypothetical protein
VSSTRMERRIARGRLRAAPTPLRQHSQRLPHLVVHIAGIGNRLGNLVPERGPEPLTQPMDGRLHSRLRQPEIRGHSAVRGRRLVTRQVRLQPFELAAMTSGGVRSRASTRSPAPRTPWPRRGRIRCPARGVYANQGNASCDRLKRSASIGSVRLASATFDEPSRISWLTIIVSGTQGLGNRLIESAGHVQAAAGIRRRARLGGLLNYYERAA